MISALPALPSDMPLIIQRNHLSRVRLFLVLSLASILGFYVWFTWASPGLTTPLGNDRQIYFVILLIVHAGLHWSSQYLGKRFAAAIIYLSVQAILLCTIGLLVHYPALLLFLLPPLLGEMVCIFERPWLQPVTVIYLYGLYFVSSNVSTNWSMLQWSAATIISTLASTFFAAFLLWISGNLPLIGLLALEQRSWRQAHGLLVELDAAHRQLAAYAEQVERLTLTAERARMARELHDTLAQGLAGLVLQMEALEEHVEREDNQKAIAAITQMKGRARAALADSRRAIDDLRIGLDGPESLIEGIKQEAERFSNTAQVPCVLDLPPRLLLPTSSTEHTLRFISEALANIARHARASQAFVSVRLEGKTILVEVRDNGIGFEPEAALHRAGHYGLLGLHERARLAGGSLELNSAIGKGTTLRMRLAMTNGGHAP